VASTNGTFQNPKEDARAQQSGYIFKQFCNLLKSRRFSCRNARYNQLLPGQFNAPIEVGKQFGSCVNG